MMFVWRKCLGPCKRIKRAVKENFKTIYNHNTVRAIFAEVHWEGLAQNISIRPYDQGFQSSVQQPREVMCVTQLSHWFLQTSNPSLSQTSWDSSGSWSFKISGRGLALLLTVINLSQNWKCKVPMSSLVVLCKIDPYHYPLQTILGLDCFVSAVLWEQHFPFSVFPRFQLVQ